MVFLKHSFECLLARMKSLADANVIITTPPQQRHKRGTIFFGNLLLEYLHCNLGQMALYLITEVRLLKIYRQKKYSRRYIHIQNLNAFQTYMKTMWEGLKLLAW